MKAHVKQTKRYTRSTGGNLFFFLLVTAMGLFTILPLIYCITTSFKPLEELMLFPPRLFTVRRPTLANYSALPSLLSSLSVPISRYVFNSVFVAAVTTLLHILVASMAAYVLAKTDLKGRRIIFWVVQFALLYNATTLAVPQYMVFTQTRMIDTYLVYILPYLPSTMGVFLMKQYMDDSVPAALLEAARIDGAGHFTIYLRIVMPLVKPAWLTLTLFAFRDMWSVQPTGTIFSEEMKT
ncbi:MAG TPA: carbohydrate ABC transporter permease, partial [Firmicutes bacterium]|nr:carbohydrate ABC transporter permease [Bacillota bacterium]